MYWAVQLRYLGYVIRMFWNHVSHHFAECFRIYTPIQYKSFTSGECGSKSGAWCLKSQEWNLFFYTPLRYKSFTSGAWCLKSQECDLELKSHYCVIWIWSHTLDIWLWRESKSYNLVLNKIVLKGKACLYWGVKHKLTSLEDEFHETHLGHQCGFKYKHHSALPHGGFKWNHHKANFPLQCNTGYILE